VMRPAQLAGILVFNVGRRLQRIRRTAHATPRGRCFSSWNGHVGVLWSVSTRDDFGASSNTDRVSRQIARQPGCRSRPAL
jgi:hypothetical protein